MLTQADTAAVRQSTRTRTGRRGSVTGTAVETTAATVADTIDGERDAQIRAALQARLAELRGEYDEIRVDTTASDHDGLTPVTGDDVADIGTKTFAREQEVALGNALRDQMYQVERALERLAAGGYGSCEACAQPIPPARLAVYPSATLCVACKQRQER